MSDLVIPAGFRYDVLAIVGRPAGAAGVGLPAPFEIAVQ
jgi:hypothetical protein